MKFISYAQNFEDVILWRVFKNIKNGTYIDIGANDPIIDSVTKAFYNEGWRGINVEPVKYWYEKINNDRRGDINLNIAISNKSGIFNFYEIPDTGLSTFDEKTAKKHINSGYNCNIHNIETRTLTDICLESKIKEIHFLKIDVEGHEKEILEGFDLHLFRPWVILIETNEPLSNSVTTHHKWENILIDNEYEFSYYDGINRFYVDKQKKYLIKNINIPPNYFDNFILYRDWKAYTDLEAKLNNLYNSFSWRYTHPFRLVSRPIKKLLKIFTN